MEDLLYVSTEYVTLTIRGNAGHPVFSDIQYSQEDSILTVLCDHPFTMEYFGKEDSISSENEKRPYYLEQKIMPIFFEQQRYEILIEGKQGSNISFWHDNLNVRKSVKPLKHHNNLLTGVINFGNEIGLSDLTIMVDQNQYLKITIEVFPSKIDYKGDYRELINDVTSEVYNLAFDFLKKTYQSFDVSKNTKSSPVEFFSIIKKIYKDFIGATDMILNKPHHQLITEHEIIDGHKIKRTDNRTIRWIEKHPEQVLKKDNKILVNKALAVKKHVTYNTKENQITKFMLQNTVRRLENFKIQYSKLFRETDEEVIFNIEKMIHSIQRRSNTGFLKEVDVLPPNSSMSLVFNMAPGYRDLFKQYLLLQHGLSITGSVFNISMKDMAVLYEYWCFIKLNSILKQKYLLKSQDIIKHNGKGLFVSLVKGVSSNVKYLNEETNEEMVLSYNPKEVNVPTVNQKPDNVLKLEKVGSQVNYEYIFDAKYRINPAVEGSYYKNLYKLPGPQEDDINTMHRYRDSIVCANENYVYQRKMFGAYVLFPYKNEEEYKAHHFYNSIGKVNVGGLPFLPSSTKLVEQLLNELIQENADHAFNRATLPIGIEEQ